MKIVNESLWAVYQARSQSQADRSDLAEIDRINGKRYRGGNPKRRVDNNPNYYDHNVLGLENRLLENADRNWFSSIDKGIHLRRKSQDSVSALFYLLDFHTNNKER